MWTAWEFGAKFRRSDSGQAMVVIALAMVLIMGAAGLAVDMGYLRYVQRRAQTAADSAALAATAELLNGDYVTAGQNDAASNGFTNDVNNVTVAINYPPTIGLYANQANFVEAIVSQNVTPFFMKALGYSTVTVSARATGHYWSGTNCIFALSSTATDAILINGSNTISAACGAMDDSDASQAFLNNGSSSFTDTGTMVTGGYLNNGSGTISPSPATGVAPESDPLAYLTEPTVGSCTYSTQQVYNGSGSATLSPGVYCGGILVNGTETITLNAGTYIIDGGSLTVNGTSTVTGTNVMFYITGGASVTFNGSNSTKLVAPTTGTYAGILFFQDRTDSSAVTINGTNETQITGALYFPDAQLTYNGGGPATAYTILVANTIVFNGSSTINDNYASLTDGSPIKSATLAE